MFSLVYLMLYFYACSLVVYSLLSMAVYTPKKKCFAQHRHWFSYGHSFLNLGHCCFIVHGVAMLFCLELVITISGY